VLARPIWHLDAHIKSDQSLLDQRLLEILGDMRLFKKNSNHSEGSRGRSFFLRYENIVGFEIDESDLICISCASNIFLSFFDFNYPQHISADYNRKVPSLHCTFRIVVCNTLKITI
jgi:hypothetical protein